MNRTSELILRNAEALPPGSVLLFNPPRDTLFRELAARAPARLFTQDFGDYAWLANAGAEASFGLLPWPWPRSNVLGASTEAIPASSTHVIPGIEPHGTAGSEPNNPPTPEIHVIPAPEPGSPENVILFLPREKERLDFLLHAIADHLPADGTLWLVGENRAGIKSAGKRLQTRFEVVRKLDSARHCGLFEASAPRPGDPFRLEDYRAQWELELPAGLAGGPLRIASLPGVFAHGRLDGGTALLLQFLGHEYRRLRIAGSVLDFGCGAGVLGLALLRANPQLRMTLLDSSAAALTSAAWSVEANGFPAGTVEVLPADGLTESGPRYDWIVSNPPFHRGVETDLDIARQFFGRAAARLSRTGRLLLVCNRHLPYERWLDEHFGVVENPHSDREFKILLASLR